MVCTGYVVPVLKLEPSYLRNHPLSCHDYMQVSHHQNQWLLQKAISRTLNFEHPRMQSKCIPETSDTYMYNNCHGDIQGAS